MQSRAARAAVAVAAIAVIVVLFIVLNGGDDDSGKTTSTPAAQSTAPGTTGDTTNGATGGSTTGTSQEPAKPAAPKAQTIIVRNGKPAGGIRKLNYKKGEQVRLVVDSDVADEIHVHGYDLMKDVAAGGKARFSFPASIEGVFEIELEGRRQQIAQLKVEPS